MVDFYLCRCYNYFDNEQNILRKEAVTALKEKDIGML